MTTSSVLLICLLSAAAAPTPQLLAHQPDGPRVATTARVGGPSAGPSTTGSPGEAPLTLEAAMALARENAPEVGSARAQVLAAKAQNGAALAAWFPTVSGSLSTSVGAQASQIHYSATSASCVDPTSGCGLQSGAQLSSGANARLSANWTLLDFGQRAAAVSASSTNVRAAEADVDTVRLQAAVSAAGAFLELAGNEELLDAQRSIVTSRERALTIAEERVEVGVAAPVEVTRARVSLETARLDWATAQAAVQSARTALATALGLDPAQTVNIVTVAPTTGFLLAADAAADAAERNRPELRAARLRLVAQESNIVGARSQFLPTLGLSASAGASAGAYTTPNVNTAETLSAGLTLNIPLFDLSLFSNLRAAEAQSTAASATLRAQQLSVRAEAAGAAVSVQTQGQALAQAEQLVVQTGANLQEAEGRYQEGAGTLLELVDAQAQDASAQVSLVRARFQLRAAEVRLKMAMGDA